MEWLANLNRRSHEYTIHPRHWRKAIERYTDFFHESRPIYEPLQAQKNSPDAHFMTPITMSENDSPSLKNLAAEIAWISERNPHLPFINTRLSEMKGHKCDQSGLLGIAIQLLPKLKWMSPPKEVVLYARVQHRKHSWCDLNSKLVVYSHRAVIQKKLKGYGEHIEAVLKRMAKPYANMLIDEAEQFTGKKFNPSNLVGETSPPLMSRAVKADCASKLIWAEHSINRRIKEILDEETAIVFSDSFWRIPPEIRLTIWRLAMNIKPVITPYKIGKASPYEHALDMPLEDAPQISGIRELDLALPTGGALRDKTAEALYAHTTFRFSSTWHLQKFLTKVPVHARRLLRSVELWTDWDIMMCYLGKLSSVDSEFDGCGRWRLEDLFDLLQGGRTSDAPPAKLTVQFATTSTPHFIHGPNGRLGDGSCHLALCKWIARSVTLRAMAFPGIRVGFAMPPDGAWTFIGWEQRTDNAEEARAWGRLQEGVNDFCSTGLANSTEALASA